MYFTSHDSISWQPGVNKARRYLEVLGSLLCFSRYKGGVPWLWQWLPRDFCERSPEGLDTFTVRPSLVGTAWCSQTSCCDNCCTRSGVLAPYLHDFHLWCSKEGWFWSVVKGHPGSWRSGFNFLITCQPCIKGACNVQGRILEYVV